MIGFPAANAKSYLHIHSIASRECAHAKESQKLSSRYANSPQLCVPLSISRAAGSASEAAEGDVPFIYPAGKTQDASQTRRYVPELQDTPGRRYLAREYVYMYTRQGERVGLALLSGFAMHPPRSLVISTYAVPARGAIELRLRRREELYGKWLTYVCTFIMNICRMCHYFDI